MIKKNFFLSGFTEFLILSLLYDKDSYVYEIAKNIADYSDKFLSISQNTIYTAAYKLLSERYISEYSKLVGRKRTRVYYHLEPLGEKYLSELTECYNHTIQGVGGVLSKRHCKGADTNEQNL